MRYRNAFLQVAVLAGAAFVGGCGAAGRGASAREGVNGDWGALIRVDAGQRDSVALHLAVQPTGAVGGTGERWLGHERMPLLVHGRLVGDTLSLTVADSGSWTRHGPAAINCVRRGDTLSGTLAEGPFQSQAIFHRPH